MTFLTVHEKCVCTYAAHLRQRAAGEFQVHSLEDHLHSVAKLAALFAAQTGAAQAPDQVSASWACLLGLWHDLGKYQSAFQKYIASASGLEAHIEAPGRVKHGYRRGDPRRRSARRLWSPAGLSDRGAPRRFARLGSRRSQRRSAFTGITE